MVRRLNMRYEENRFKDECYFFLFGCVVGYLLRWGGGAYLGRGSGKGERLGIRFFIVEMLG